MVLAPRIYNIITSQTKCDTYTKNKKKSYTHGDLSGISLLLSFGFPRSGVGLFVFCAFHFIGSRSLNCFCFFLLFISYFLFSLVVWFFCFSPMKNILSLYIFKWRWAITHTPNFFGLIWSFAIYTLTNKISLFLSLSSTCWPSWRVCTTHVKPIKW